MASGERLPSISDKSDGNWQILPAREYLTSKREAPMLPRITWSGGANSYGVAERPRSFIGPPGVCCETVSKNPSDAKRTQASIEIRRLRKGPFAARAAAADRQKRDRTPGRAADEVVTRSRIRQNSDAAMFDARNSGEFRYDLGRSPRKCPISRQPCSKASGDRAADASSYDVLASGAMPEPARANGTGPWLCVLIRSGVG